MIKDLNGLRTVRWLGAVRGLRAVALTALAAASLQGCVPALMGGAVIGGGLMVTDRRTTGTQVEDESIELRAAARVRALGTKSQVSVTSYNRMVLITGEVQNVADKAAIEKAVLSVENVRSVVNDLTLAFNSGLGARAGDALLSTKVKASLIDAKDLQANAYKVVAERGVIYMMGRVTEREALRGIEVARAVPGVEKVVRLFEILSEAEIAHLGRRTGAGATVAAPVAMPASAATGASAPK